MPGADPHGAVRVVDGVEDAVDLIVGGEFVCWLDKKRSVRCLGGAVNDAGELLRPRGRVVLTVKDGERVQSSHLGVCVEGKASRRCWGRTKPL